MEFVELLLSEFQKQAHPQNALLQKKYMKEHFDFFGIKATERRNIQQPFLNRKCLPEKQLLKNTVKALWAEPQRECQYFAQEFVAAYTDQLEVNDIHLLVFMIVHKSWWDTVDFIAVTLVGSFFKKYPNKIVPYTKEWLESGNIWLQRTVLLFQLKYKSNLDTLLLSESINYLLGSKEFFLNKAIGWVLREYSKTNPEWVREFICYTPLSNLSKREAGKYL